ncbi:class I SAM-dependent DNA methyltransferase [Kocuria sp. KSNUG]|uniref:type I restriction-modification system subunit M n=1 Tax=Kocuria sp. KSNUG TaxID=3136676 RepID=UPI003C2C6383
MITGEFKSKIDRVWNTFWTGGISNPLEVIEQITYLLYIKRLDQEQELIDRKASRTGRTPEDPIFGPGDEQKLRWSHLKNQDPATAYELMDRGVFPLLRRLGGESAYTEHMRDARFTIPTPALLHKVIDLLDQLDLRQDTNGDLYEYLLSKLASAGVNGQFRTPRHIIDLMVDLTEPNAEDTICDPACGTAGFLVSASEYLREHDETLFSDPKKRAHYGSGMFHGYDFDSTMLRIASMNMLMHGIGSADIRYRDSLAEVSRNDATYSLILANPPFAGSLDYGATSQTLLKTIKTKKTELLFLALFLEMLETGGRAAVIVPDGVLFGSSKAHKDLRRMLVEEQKLDAVIKLPSGVFKPYAGVSTAILLFTKTDSGGTDNVWFYDVRADGYSLDDKRTPVDANDLPDVREHYRLFVSGNAAELGRARTEQSFVVPKEEIAEQGYDLSLNRYREVVQEEVEHRSPTEIVDDIERLNQMIEHSLASLKADLR